MSEKQKYLTVSFCSAHRCYALCIETIDADGGGGGRRLTPSKCCGSWPDLRKWPIEQIDRKELVEFLGGVWPAISEQSSKVESKPGLCPNAECNRMVTVCKSCKMASCWRGSWPCDDAKCADTEQLPVWRLRELDLEHSSQYAPSDDYPEPAPAEV